MRIRSIDLSQKRRVPVNYHRGVQYYCVIIVNLGRCALNNNIIIIMLIFKGFYTCANIQLTLRYHQYCND